MFNKGKEKSFEKLGLSLKRWSAVCGSIYLYRDKAATFSGGELRFVQRTSTRCPAKMDTERLEER